MKWLILYIADDKMKINDKYYDGFEGEPKKEMRQKNMNVICSEELGESVREIVGVISNVRK